MIKLRLYDLIEGLNLAFIGPFYRSVGKNLAQSGLRMQGNLTSDDRVVPSLRCKSHNNQFPSLAKADFIAPNSSVIGQVNTGEQSSIWYGATLRGDQAQINIGNQTIVQDLVQIQPTSNKNVQIGDNVFIGSNATLDSCVLENNSFIGMGATVSSGSKVESYGIVAAGAVVPPNTTVKANQIWAGNPAQYLRDITPEEKQVIDEHHQETVYLARIHSEETEKNFRDIIDDLDEKNNERFEDSEALALKKMQELGFPMDFDDEDYLEQRVFLKKASGPKESEFWKKQYDAYEQDLHHFPDSFKQYGENYERYEEVKKYFEENPFAEAQAPTNTEFEYPKNHHDWTRKY